MSLTPSGIPWYWEALGFTALEMSDDSGAAKPEAPVSEPNFDTKCLYARLGVQKDANDEQVAGAPRLAIAARVYAPL